MVCRQSPFWRCIEGSVAVTGRSASVSSALEKGFGVGGVGSAGFWKPSVSGRAIVMGIAKAWRPRPREYGIHGEISMSFAARGGAARKQRKLAAPRRKNVLALRHEGDQ